jgi:hypothetical protein
MVWNLTKYDLLQYWPFKIEIKKKVWKILFTKIYYEWENFSLKFEEKNLDKVVDYLRMWHRKLQHDNEFVASLKHRARQNRLLFYR